MYVYHHHKRFETCQMCKISTKKPTTPTSYVGIELFLWIASCVQCLGLVILESHLIKIRRLKSQQRLGTMWRWTIDMNRLIQFAQQLWLIVGQSSTSLSLRPGRRVLRITLYSVLSWHDWGLNLDRKVSGSTLRVRDWTPEDRTAYLSLLHP